MFSPGLSEELGAHVSLKLETATPISAFKVRGGLHLLLEMREEERRRGIVTASSGNHAQSIAYAARLSGARARIYMPAEANPDKVAAVRRLDADVVLVGRDFDEARLEAEERAAETGARYVHAVNTPELLAGVGTAALEVLESQQPDSDLVIVPLGGGSGACGWITVRDGLGRATEIWATQSAQAPAVHDSWRSGSLLRRPNTTIAEGLATGVAFALPFPILRRGLADFILVEDREIEDAVRRMLDLAHVLAEPAGAAPAAAALRERDRLRGRKVVLVVSGANITRDQLRRII